MEITVKVVDLLWKARELNKAEMDYVTLSVIDESEMDDGKVLPRALHFEAFSDKDPYMAIDYEEVEEADIERDEGSVMFTNIK